MSEYPRELLQLMEKNIETADFVLSYPREKNMHHGDDISREVHEGEVPLFMQWDKRWGYKEYSGQLAAFSACGPVCLSMAAVYTTGDTSLTPAFMIDFAIENGYSTDGSGSMHSLIYEGGPLLGLDVIEMGLADGEMKSRMEKGNAVICLMGPGDFTAKGHFVVLCSWRDGKIKVNDPNSLKNSQKLWNWRDIKQQIRRAWVVVKYK